MNKAIMAFFVGLLRFFWPSVNETDREKIGTWVTVIGGIIGALAYAFAQVAPLVDAEVPAPDPVEVPAPVDGPGVPVDAVDGDDAGPLDLVFGAVSSVLGMSCGRPLTATEQEFAGIGLDALGAASLCGINYLGDAIEGTADGDAALACLIRIAAAKGLQVLVKGVELLTDGVTYGGTSTSVTKTRVVYHVAIVPGN